jgi:hypothetical protein
VPDRLIRITTAAAAATVAAVAAVISYSHACELAGPHGETGVTARLVPFTVDGLILAASMLILEPPVRQRRHRGHPAAVEAGLGRASARVRRVPHQHPPAVDRAPGGAGQPPVRQHRHRGHHVAGFAELDRAGPRVRRVPHQHPPVRQHRHREHPRRGGSRARPGRRSPRPGPTPAPARRRR